MEPEIAESLASLRLMPNALEAAVRDRPEDWLDRRHGQDMLSPREVVGHFVQGELEDWIPRTHMILTVGESEPFSQFDPYAWHDYAHATPIKVMLAEFRKARLANVDEIERILQDPTVLDKKGMHPRLGPVTLRELVHTWAAHDLYHLGQIYKAFSVPFKERIGPWQDSLNIPQFY